jgi:hypothetical protein
MAYPNPHRSALPQEGSSVVIVQRRVEGVELGTTLDAVGGPLAEADVARHVVVPLLRALAHLHSMVRVR